MTIPSAVGFWKPVLQVLDEVAIGNVSPTKEVVRSVLDRSNLTDEELAQTTPTGKLLARNRVEWAVTQLRQEGLLDNQSRGRIYITEAGRQRLHSGDFQGGGLTQSSGAQEQAVTTLGQWINADTPPDELMAWAHGELRGQLAQELLENLHNISWERFEHLCVHLLEKMGYGKGMHLGQTGDGGVDGVISQDALGLERVYIQAKRWTNDRSVGEPEIRNFSGSLATKGAKKGILITSSHFNSHAKQSANAITNGGSQAIILVEGLELANLLIEHGVGVVTEQSFEIKKLDENYFAEDI